MLYCVQISLPNTTQKESYKLSKLEKWKGNKSTFEVTFTDLHVQLIQE